MDAVRPLEAARLRRSCDPATVPFETTAGCGGADRVIGQERAQRALEFGIGVAGEDYNVFVMGPAGSGRHGLVREVLGRHAARSAPPSDWVYVNNFAAPQRPLALELPAGRGEALRADMEALVGELRAAIPAIFESEEYTQRVERIEAEISGRRDEAVRRIGADAEAQGIALLRTPAGYGFAPMKAGEVVSSEEYEKLPQEERERITRAIAGLEERLQQAVREAMRGRKERAERVRALDREMVQLALEPLFQPLERRYADIAPVVGYLHAVREDMLENAEGFRPASDVSPLAAIAFASAERNLRRYEVNVLVSRRAPDGTQPVFCDHPTYARLIGCVEHIHHLGTLVTDFTLVKAGALHRANGGFLVADALKVLTQPFAWEALKRALTRREVRVEAASELWGLAATASIEPEPIPLRVKVVLIGERSLYYLLQALDPDFNRLFKVVADFEDEVQRDDASSAALARVIAGMAARCGLLPLDRVAVARAIDESARLAGDSCKLSADMAALERLLREADFLAREAGAAAIGVAHLEAADAARRARAGRAKRRVDEAIGRGVLAIETSGSKVAQVNGLALVALGEFPFAEPTRITATTRVGDGEVIDIQRESRLGGSLHSKGVMILSQFLAARFSGRRPHSLAASLVFEQTYGPVEGDSASLAELCALLSSLAGAPLAQSLAVTGAVDQMGDVQAVGGVNEKVEGFFDVCSARGLDATHGVIIPATNAADLMLAPPVVDACAKGRFRVYAVANVDEALALLSGLAPEALNARVARRLQDFARARAGASGAGPGRRLVRRQR